MGDAAERERWGSRIGLILAAAGNAVGIGNLLRFPGKAATNGGGAFMIPYVVSLLVFGLPMMWIAWTIGRYGGRFGHGSLPGQFDRMARSPLAKYLGVLGVAMPLVFCLYYTYIEAWCLGYGYFSLTRFFESTPGRTVDLEVFLGEFLGDAPTHSYFAGVVPAFVFFIITLGLNVWVLHRGVAKGIELLAKIAMPLLLLFCVVLAVRVFTLGQKQGTAWQGLSFLWTPDFKALLEPQVWIAAAGQIFFTLSIGFGAMECYASYLRENDDVTLTGLTTAATNEFVEVIFGSIIAIPAAAVFFGAGRIPEIAGSGTFAIGMISMPEILRNTPGLELFGTMWFLLLFFAAFTSSVAVAQPVIAFFQDEFRLRRESSAALVALFWLLGTLPVIWFFKYGVLDEMDFWAGTIGLVVCALIEVVLFAWIFGMDKGWEEMHRGADLQVPRFFYFVMKYVTPVALFAILTAWFYDAVAKDTLVPAPKITWGVENRARYPGEFRKGLPPECTPEEREQARKGLEGIEKSVLDAVRAARRDLRAMIDVELDGRGRARVVSFSADPALREVLDAASFERWLALQGWRYEEHNGRSSAPVKATLVFEALHRAPYIWLTRVLIAAVFVVFLVLIHVAWKTRPALPLETPA
jgi:SNF family Na+-dependent transporter